MLTNSEFGVIAECDFCCETLDTDSSDFKEAIAAMKSEGWVITKEQGEWAHRCPCCAENLMNDFEV